MKTNSELDRLKSYSAIDKELQRAKKLHPNYPDNMFEQLAIMTEEAGEVTKAVLDYHHSNKPLQDIKDELIQTAAMCMRMLENLPAEAMFTLHHNNVRSKTFEDNIINEGLFEKELFEYNIVERESVIDDLCGWIDMCGPDREHDKALMKKDLKELIKIDDEYIFSSVSTNRYVHSKSSDFNKICNLLIENNKRFNKSQKQ